MTGFSLFWCILNINQQKKGENNMKRLDLMTIVICFVLSGTLDNFAQTRKTAKKPVRKKLVKCYENGKQVYRTKCRTPQVITPSLEVAPVTTTKPQKDELPYGITGGLSRGQGSGGGIGYGRGRNSDDDDDTGNGSKNNSTQTTVPIPKNQIGPTTALKIISKPRPNYTDAARQNNVNGTVVLKVTFLASGAIGAISPVKGLPNGLTEQAIAAARQIRFEPARKNGVPYTVTKSVTYNFTIY
jgi:TonB family protein